MYLIDLKSFSYNNTLSKLFKTLLTTIFGNIDWILLHYLSIFNLEEQWKEHTSQAIGKEKTSMALEKEWALKTDALSWQGEEQKEDQNLL